MRAPDNDKLAKTILGSVDYTRVLHIDHEVPSKHLISHKFCRIADTIHLPKIPFLRALYADWEEHPAGGFGTGATLRCLPHEQSRPAKRRAFDALCPGRPRSESMCLSRHSPGFVLAAARQLAYSAKWDALNFARRAAQLIRAF
jgi:hypothetical protein